MDLQTAQRTQLKNEQRQVTESTPGHEREGPSLMSSYAARAALMGESLMLMDPEAVRDFASTVGNSAMSSILASMTPSPGTAEFRMPEVEAGTAPFEAGQVTAPQLVAPPAFGEGPGPMAPAGAASINA